MNKFLRPAALSLLTLCLSLSCFAQEGQVEMADMMRSNGKIYVVIAVILTILTGLILYLVRIDRRVTKLERESS
jgi:CcmD family protein